MDCCTANQQLDVHANQNCSPGGFGQIGAITTVVAKSILIFWGTLANTAKTRVGGNLSDLLLELMLKPSVTAAITFSLNEANLRCLTLPVVGNKLGHVLSILNVS